MNRNVAEYQTSEKVKIDYEIASLYLRIAAKIFDSLIQAGIIGVLYLLMIIFVISGTLASSSFFSDDSNTSIGEIIGIIVMVVFVALILLFILCYHLFFELIWKGQTPGKKAIGIRVINDNGSYIKPTGAILRNIFRIVDFLPFSNITGVISISANKKNKRIGDIVAGTIVIKESKVSLNSFEKKIELECFNGLKEPKKILSEKEIEIIKNYIESKKELSEDIKVTIEDKISTLIEKKSDVLKPSDVNKENFITAFYQLF